MCFEIVLPRFQVLLYVPTYVVQGDTDLIGAVAARCVQFKGRFVIFNCFNYVIRYTYGKPVQGRVCVYVTPTFTSLHYYSRYRTISPTTLCQPVRLCAQSLICATTCTCYHIVQIDGLSDFSVLLKSVIKYNRWPTTLEVNVTVTEEGTGVSINSSQLVMVASKPLLLHFLPGTPSLFQPGLPFTVKVHGT